VSDIDLERLVEEIRALREAAKRFTRIADTDIGDIGDIGGAWTDLEAAAVAYVRKLDDETFRANKIDYLAIVEAAQRDAKEPS
jgi:hypothetical protein